MQQSKSDSTQAIQLARTHYENFTVLSLLMSRALRHDVANLYAYCRTVDDIGDEASGPRLLLLAHWEQDLLQCWQGTPRHPVLVALQGTIQRHTLPQKPFRDLIEANRRDQTRMRYGTWQELLEYCSYSANPVGRLYLRLLGYNDTERDKLADLTSTALQLANFWQDISRDVGLGRIYIPSEAMRQYNVTEDDVLNGRNSHNSAAMIEHLCNETALYFDHGLALLKLLSRRQAYNVRLFSLGGLAILRTVKQNSSTGLSQRPSLRRIDKWRLAVSAVNPRSMRLIY